MNILTDSLPLCVEIDGKEALINWGFQTSIRFSMLIEDSEKDKEEKLLEGLKLYYPQFKKIRNVGAAVDRMLWFYNCGKDYDDDARSARRQGSNRVSTEKAFSYDVDAEKIYAAFYEQYGMDLNKITLHWWKFRALFECLSEKTQIGKIMSYRTMDLSGLDKEEAAYYRKMRKMYKLPENITTEEQKKLAALNDVLKNGGDISALIGGDDEEN